jgi:hypothetical protein
MVCLIQQTVLCRCLIAAAPAGVLCNVLYSLSYVSVLCRVLWTNLLYVGVLNSLMLSYVSCLMQMP